MIITGVRSDNFVGLSAKGLDGTLQDAFKLDMGKKRGGRGNYELRGPMRVGKRRQNRIVKLDYLTLLRQVSLNVRLVLELQGCT